MSVKKFTLKIDKDNKFINIPLTLTHSEVGQDDTIDNHFVKQEVEKAINPIVDYEKNRFEPNQKDKFIGRIDYDINLLKDGAFPESTTLETIGFVDNDIKYRRNNFKKSFLNLMFFDSDVPTNQNYLGNITIFNRLSRFDIQGISDPIKVEKEKEPEEVEVDKSDWLFGDLELGSTKLGKNVIKGIRRERIGTENVFARKCQSVNFGFAGGTQVTGYYYRGPFYNIASEFTKEGERCEDFEKGIFGDVVPPKGLGIPYSLFDAIYLNQKGYVYGSKVYDVYSKWSYDFMFPSAFGKFGGVYFIDVTPDGGDSNGDTTIKPSNPIIGGVPKPVGEIPLKFIVENPITTPRGFAEGFYVYHYADLPTSIYMRGNYNNAKTGKVSDLITTPEPQNIENVVSKLHTKYDLKNVDDNYYYELDTEYSTNISVVNDTMSVSLYEIQVL